MVIAISAATMMVGQPVALDPVGKWTLNYGDSRCVLSHAFTGAGGIVSVGLQLPMLDGYDVLVLLVPKDLDFGKPSGSATITFPTGERVESSYGSRLLADTNERGIRIDVEDAVFKKILAAPNIAITLGGTALPPLALRATTKAMAALKTCREAQMVRWGIDVVVVAKTVTPAAAISPASWISIDDYPSDAVRTGTSGTSVVLLTVGINGRITDCRVTQTSGSPSLDAATCNAFTRHGRFSPAKGAGSMPLMAWSERRVVWNLPAN